MLQLLQICSRYKRRELELSKQSITLTLKHLFSRLALLFSPFFISTSQPPPSTLPLWRSIASSLSHRTLSFASIILTSSSLIDVLKHDVFYSFLWFFFLFLLWLLVWGAIEYICIYLYTSISFCLFLFLIIFATRFSSVFWFVCFFPEGADWPESASTSTLSLFAQSKCPSFVFCFFAFFSLPAVTCSAWNVQMARAQTHLQTLVYSQTHRIHTRVHGKTHIFFMVLFAIPSPSFLSHQREKKPQTTTFLIKFLWALFCLATPSLNLKKNQALVDLFFWQFFCFQGARKASVPPQGFPYVVPFFWFLVFVFWNKNEKKAVGLDGGPTMSYPPYWVCFFVFCF